MEQMLEDEIREKDDQIEEFEETVSGLEMKI